MFDDDGDAVAVFDFEELANHLLEQGLDSSPSKLHGCLCGLLAAGAPRDAESGLALLMQALELDTYGDLASQMMQLYTVTAAALEDEEFDFHPLLPDDETDIEQRTVELGYWCSGFLTGFAKVNQSQLGKENGEILRDLAAIAEAGVDEDEDEDEQEGSYIEIVEYIRFAALNIYTDNIDQPPQPGQPSIH